METFENWKHLRIHEIPCVYISIGGSYFPFELFQIFFFLLQLYQNPMAMIQNDDFLDKLKEMLTSPQVQSGCKAHKLVDVLEDLFARAWIYSRHLVLIIECFGRMYGYTKQTRSHGTYRVDLIVALFGRIVDLHNFEFVVSAH